MLMDWLFPQTAVDQIAESMRNGATRELDAVVLVGFSGTDNFHLTYGGNESANIIRGTNYTAAGIKAAIEGITDFPDTVTVSDVTDSAFLVEFNTPGALSSALTFTNPTGVTGSVGQLVAGSDAEPGDTLSLKGAQMRLFTNDIDLTPLVTVGMLTEATFDGYAVSAGIEWDEPYPGPLGVITFLGQVLQWVCTGSGVSETVRGGWLVKDGEMVAIGKFQTAVPISAAGQVVVALPQVKLPVLSWSSDA